MITFSQTTSACMSGWHADLACFKEDANTRVRHILISLGLASTPFFINEAEQQIELDHVLLRNVGQWYPRLCTMLETEPTSDRSNDEAVAVLEAHLWHVYADYLHGLLEESRQVMTVDAVYQVCTWLSADDGYRAVVRTATHVVVRTEQGLRTRLDATLAALWRLKHICQVPAQSYDL